ncbi:MAG: transcriptional repressor [Anaerolineae bacterium]|nr:transcriptional repressor [Anaerolineae bacterium]
MPDSKRLQRLRDAGYKITHARQTVLAALEQTGGHMTSAQVLEAVAQLDPSIGRASVFRTLDTLSRLSIIRPTFVDGSGAPVFVLLPDGHHHHIVCTGCGQVTEFEDCGLDALAARLQGETGVTISGHLLEFYGLCAACRPTES